MNKAYILGLLLLTSCSHFWRMGCDLESKVTKASADVVARELECSKPEAIQKDLTDLLRSKVDICKEQPQPVSVNSWICKKAGETAIEQVAKKIPAAWECKATKVKDSLKSLVEKACSEPS